MEYNVDNADAKITFIDVVLGFMQMKNADVYVTGSNSKMLSYDILTQFRDRGGEIRVYPLPFAEFYNEYKGDKRGRMHFMSHISTAKRNCWKSMRNTGAIPVPLGRW